jgi:LmbE family N-acetylglucosaminyl deacetylase
MKSIKNVDKMVSNNKNIQKHFAVLLIITVLAIGVYIYENEKVEVLRVSYSVPHKVSQGATLLVLSPHFDDGVLSLGGLLASYPERATVVSFFTTHAGEPLKTRWDRISGFADSREATERRNVENEAALQSLGVAGQNFTYEDAQYRNTDNTNEIQKAITKDIRTLLSKYGKEKVFIYGPAVFSSPNGNRDHKILHDAFLEVARDLDSRKNLTFFIYEDIPYARQFLKSQRTTVLEFLQATDHITISPEVVFLSSAQVNSKLSALRQYGSQIKAFRMLHRDLEGEAREFLSHRVVSGAAEIVYRIVTDDT